MKQFKTELSFLEVGMRHCGFLSTLLCLWEALKQRHRKPNYPVNTVWKIK